MLVAVTAVVLGVTGMVQAIGPTEPMPASADTVVQETASASTSTAATPTDLPDPVQLGADSTARRVTRAGLERTTVPVDIPDVALSAYQRAAVVINDADPDCRLDWSLVAAIGYVESDHGRHAGSRLDDEGVARPEIRGIRLDGTRHTQRIKDTDAGVLDGDKRFDRAVGPMQILPSTWSLIGVDADGDDVRDPQDVDDAALAAAVYLCAGSQDLSTEAGRRAAVHRYNPDDDYVALVLEIAESYADGDVVTTTYTVGVLGTPTPVHDPSTPAVAAARPPAPGENEGPSEGTLTTEPVRPSDSPSPSSDPSPTPTSPSTPPTTGTPTPTPPTPSDSVSSTPSAPDTADPS